MNEFDCDFPCVNAAAPGFTARTSQGGRCLEDYEGQWLILFSHPADCTPVWTHEFIAFATTSAKLKDMNCELLGLSSDNTHSHVAWMQRIKHSFGIECPLTIIDDNDMNIARSYGIVGARAVDGQAARAAFFIDPAGQLRAKMYHRMSEGRSIGEFVRLLTAIQSSVSGHGDSHASWTSNRDNIVPSPRVPAALETSHRHLTMREGK